MKSLIERNTYWHTYMDARLVVIYKLCYHITRSKKISTRLNTRMPLLNRMRTVETRAYAASSVEPMWPTKAWLMTVRPKEEKRVKIEGPATTHSFLFSSHARRPSDDDSSSTCCSSSSLLMKLLLPPWWSSAALGWSRGTLLDSSSPPLLLLLLVLLLFSMLARASFGGGACLQQATPAKGIQAEEDYYY